MVHATELLLERLSCNHKIADRDRFVKTARIVLLVL